MKRLSRISNNRALLVLCVLGFLCASFGLVSAESSKRSSQSGSGVQRALVKPVKKPTSRQLTVSLPIHIINYRARTGTSSQRQYQNNDQYQRYRGR